MYKEAENEHLLKTEYLLGTVGRCFTHIVSLLSHHLLQGTCNAKKTESDRLNNLSKFTC